MDYSERIKLIITNLNAFLRQYQRPPHLDTDGSLIEVKAIAEEINNLISASSNQDALAERVEACFRSLRQNYTQRTWPTVAHFVKAMSEVQSKAAQIESADVETKSPEQIAADRMNAGEAVGDTWIYGRGALTLLKSGLVTQDVMRRYRSALYFSAKEVGGKDYAESFEARMLRRHEEAEAMMAGAA